MTRIRAHVLGATGYTGAELCRLLSRHPRISLDGCYASDRREGNLPAGIEPFRLDRVLASSADCVFLATPHETSAEIVPALLEAGKTTIDLSGAFRLRDPAAYPRWYGFLHPAVHLLPEAIYGLPEWRNGELTGRRLVANPGCYATSVLLAVKPLVPLLEPGVPVVCDAKSGVSGAGKRSELAYSFTELAGDFTAYGVGVHRHQPEIRAELGLAERTALHFVPHLLPVVRGILSTLYLTLSREVTEAEIAGLYAQVYGKAPFVTVHPAGVLPRMKQVVGSPRAEIGFVVPEGGRTVIVVSVLDNLLKGAASQAIQNLNRVFGFDEAEGLT